MGNTWIIVKICMQDILHEIVTTDEGKHEHL